jgi:hypothetical protein
LCCIITLQMLQRATPSIFIRNLLTSGLDSGSSCIWCSQKRHC